MKTPAWFSRCITHRFGGLVLFVILFVAVATFTRIGLLLHEMWAVDWNASLLASFAWGLVFDVGAALLFSLPGWLVLTLLPKRFFERRWARALGHLALMGGLAVLLFTAVSERVFWDEFSVRFNFIAVDYLVYTTEVLANINESYPMPAIFAGLAIATVGLYLLFVRTGWVDQWLEHAADGWQKRYAAGAAWLALTVLAGWGLNQGQLPSYQNNYNRELAKDGVWSLFAAFRNNELAYDEFYATLPLDEAFAEARKEVAFDGSRFLTDNPRDLLRWIDNPGEEQRLNVIQITVESLSADFLGVFNSESTLTPELDALAEKSLLFTNFYATGTRTTRGMEALSLSLPPTPGRSLIKRPRNDGLFTLGSVFQSRDYDTAFIYGGYGYFDNMNAFFSGNGYRIVDRGSVGDDDVTFANAWGACDGDLYRWTMREADADYAAGKPFHYFVMTTSNHRPYTFPDGKIDLPSKESGRAGAVKYTDQAIGEFIREASSKPWFKNTVFVVVADHCASVAGRSELPVKSYHIPLMVYAPGGQIEAGRIDDLMSQVDYAPTLLGLLNWSYASRFYGWDVRRAVGDRRALVGNYQKLGLFEEGRLDILSPRSECSSYKVDHTTLVQTRRGEPSPEPNEVVGYYQTAAWLYQNDGYKALTPAEQRRYAEQANAASGDGMAANY
ncbi:LTA synthase family protein [Actomonas aquatica]|uniref:Sulfatase-like hydrolase/transferase n=1 Tax=Actomonas aquatica TaxID=2866162 RepID=A0ABZ1C4P5_9BACT|nr:alkaline phosphatase family protein [Opitutus sp. WL0086]WRQ86466.1 sulfatase-like hydrolase/transferase [Opitutus sp. WL0086]